MTTSSNAPEIPTTIDVLQLGPWLAAELKAALGPPYRLLPLWGRSDAAAYLAQHAGQIRAIVTHSSAGTAVDRALIARLPLLELVVNLGAGSESVDSVAAAERGIAVLTGAGANAIDVAELAMALLLATVRNVVRNDAALRQGRWPDSYKPLTHRLGGKKMGVLGIGAIGMEVARRAAAFDMQVAYFARRANTNLPYRHQPDLLALARESDCLVVALPGGAQTEHLVDAKVLDALGPDGYIVNVGRGTVIDEAALVSALQDGRIAGAGLDVFEFEPKVSEGLLGSDRVVLQPHRGGLTHEAFEAIAARAVENLHRHFRP